MGWNPFKSKKKTYVATQVMRAIEDKALPNSIKQGAIKSFFENGNVSEYVLEEAIQSLAVRADRMYDYAEKKYEFGLPSGEFYSATQGKDVAKGILDSLEGSPVSLEYFRFGPPNNQHIGWLRLVQLHGYDPATNELGNLTVANGKKTYLKNMEVVVPYSQKDAYEAGALNQWGVSATSGYTPERASHVNPLIGNVSEHSPIVYSKTAVTEYVWVTYIIDAPKKTRVYQDGERVSRITYPEGNLRIQTSDIDDSADFFHAKYSVNGVTKYWMYKAGSGTYPELDAFYDDPPTELGSFYPIAYFRHNKARVDLDKESSAYKTSLKMLDYIGIDYQTMVDSIHKNPDIADVEQAMLLMAVPANTTNPIEQKYLFDFFEEQYFSQETIPKVSSKTNVLGWALNQGTEFSIVIQDKRAKFALNHRGIFKRTLVGKIGAVGAYSSSFGNVRLESKQTEESETAIRVLLSIFNQVPVHYYRKQVALNLYEELQVVDLRMVYNIWGGYNTVGDKQDAILLVPIDRNITQGYWVGDKEVLYARSLHYVFNSRVVVKVKWYQQGWFSDLLKIAAIVMLVYSMGTQGYGIYAAATAAGYTAAQALLITIITLAIQSFLIQVAFKLFVKTVGQDIAFLAAIVAAAYGVKGVMEAGGFQAAAPFAKDMLGLANGLVSAIGADIQADLKDLMGQFSDFDKYVEEQTKLLDKAEDLLKTSQVLSPFTIFGESPDDYYKRTVHSGNIGTIGIDAIGNYVERSITLPQLSSTIGEIDYDPAA